jgi:branched-chain amino acid transport system substrate-binding protein
MFGTVRPDRSQIGTAMSRRGLIAMAAIALLSGCKVIPKAGPAQLPPPVVVEAPSDKVLPTDTQRHRVALLVPLSGPNAAVGQSIANAASMALLDTNAVNLRITNYDTTFGAAAATNKAIADGNRLILGPLLSEDITAVASAARAAKVPVVSFSNDQKAAARDVFIMGSLPAQSIARTIAYARAAGSSRFAALVPSGDYGQISSTALLTEVRAQGGTVVAMETFDRTSGSVAGAVRRLRAKGGFDAVLIADGGRIAAQAGPLLKAGAAPLPRILGTELWSGESAVATAPALRGAWFSAVSDTRYSQFAASYRSRFGAAPYRVATLGYDGVLLTLRVARDWKPGTNFPIARLIDSGGFLGLDGPFRFDSDGLIERAFEVREVRASGVTVVSPAPARFRD